MIVGAHAPNGAIQAGDLAILSRWHPGGVLLMPYHTVEDIHNIRSVAGQNTRIVVRLPDSSEGGYIPSWRDYAARCWRVIQPAHLAGVWDFVLDNEPQWQPSWGSGRAWDWAAFMWDVLPEIRRLCGTHADIRIGMTPFSHPELDTWLTASARIARLCDWIAVHSYWQAPQDRYSAQFGMNAATFHRWQPDKPILITEFATSISQITPALAPAAVEDRMVKEYPDWIRAVAALPYVAGAYAFIVGGTPEWAGFRVTYKVADTLRAVAAEVDKP